MKSTVSFLLGFLCSFALIALKCTLEQSSGCLTIIQRHLFGELNG